MRFSILGLAFLTLGSVVSAQSPPDYSADPDGCFSWTTSQTCAGLYAVDPITNSSCAGECDTGNNCPNYLEYSTRPTGDYDTKLYPVDDSSGTDWEYDLVNGPIQVFCGERRECVVCEFNQGQGGSVTYNCNEDGDWADAFPYWYPVAAGPCDGGGQGQGGY